MATALVRDGAGKGTAETPHAGPTLRALELCVGAGGLALGVSRAGFHPVAVIDADNQSCNTLRLNKREHVALVRDWEICETDITQLDFTKYADIALLSGGSPCQPFSQGGKRNGRLDTRDMLPEFIRAIRECRPKAFLIENVKGLLHSSFFDYFMYVVHQLRFPEVLRGKGEKWTEHRARLECFYTAGHSEVLSYRVIWQVLDAANFGLPQRRKRVFVVGLRADLGLEYSFPLQTHSREALWFDQWVSGRYWERHGIKRKLLDVSLSRSRLCPPCHGIQPWQTVRDAIHDLPKIGPGRRSHKVLNHFLNPGARVYEGHTGSTLDLPSKTIKAGHHGVSGGENIICLDDKSVRYFSVRECARLQAFPDVWGFEGSWCSCMRQIGNAVPVTLAEIVARPLAEALAKT